MDVSALRSGLLVVSALSARNIADAWGKRFENGIKALYGGLVTADHHAIAAVQAPNAAARSDVDIINSLGLQRFGAPKVIPPKAVATVDDDVARFKQLGKLPDRGIRWHPRREA